MLEILLYAMAIGGGLLVLIGIILIIAAKMSHESGVTKAAIWCIILGAICLGLGILRISALHA